MFHQNHFLAHSLPTPNLSSFLWALDLGSFLRMPLRILIFQWKPVHQSKIVALMSWANECPKIQLVVCFFKKKSFWPKSKWSLEPPNAGTLQYCPWSDAFSDKFCGNFKHSSSLCFHQFEVGSFCKSSARLGKNNSKYKKISSVEKEVNAPIKGYKEIIEPLLMQLSPEGRSIPLNEGPDFLIKSKFILCKLLTQRTS